MTSDIRVTQQFRDGDDHSDWVVRRSVGEMKPGIVPTKDTNVSEGARFEGEDVKDRKKIGSGSVM